MFEVVHYGADGTMGEGVIYTSDSQEGCEQYIRELLGTSAETLRWTNGMEYMLDDAPVHAAYHESREEGCGGYYVREVVK